MSKREHRPKREPGPKPVPLPATDEPRAETPQSDPNTATIRVRCVRRGIYDSIERKPGQEFTITPMLLSDGKTIIPAEKLLSVDRRLSSGKLFRGWMKVLGPGKPSAPKGVTLAMQTQKITPSTEHETLHRPDAVLRHDDEESI
jgi:hypothetical protein